MKHYLLLLCFPLLLLLLTVPSGAAEYRYHSSAGDETAVREHWDRLMEALPEDVRAEVSGISPDDLAGTADALTQKTDIRYWLNLLLKYLSGAFAETTAIIAPLFSLMIFIAAVQVFLPAGISAGLQNAFLTYTGLVTALLLYRQTCGILTLTQTSLNRLCTIMNLMTPVMETILLAGGQLTQRAVSSQAVMLFVTAAGNFTGYLLAPLTNLLFTFSAVSSVCGEVKLSHLAGSLRKFIMRLIQLFTMYFSFMLGTQSILAKSADSLGMKTARFALGSFVPIAGGTIAEALSTIREGMSLVRSAAGIGGILVIVLLLLPDILRLSVYKFILYLTGTAAELLKLEKFSALANEIHGIIELLTAVVLFTALMFVLILILFTKLQVNA